MAYDLENSDFIEAFLYAIYDKKIKPNNLSEKLYFDTANRLKEGLYKGFGGTLLKFDGPPLELLTKLRTNIYLFSGAKTFTQTLELSDALTEGDRYLSWPEYRQKAADIYAKYNGGEFLQDKKQVGYLKAEYETAVTDAQNAHNWVNINAQKHIFPYLRKSVVEDENTCEICGPLDGMTAPVDDPVWNIFGGTMHFYCRCFEEQLTIYEGAPEYDKAKVEKLLKSQSELMQPMFKHNPYKTGQIFTKEHSYFAVPKEYTEFAKENFGLPVPEED